MPPPSTTAESEAGDARAGGGALAPARPRPAVRFLARAEVATAATAVAVVGCIAFLLARLVPDVADKPLFDDEVLAGLTALNPVPDLLDIVLSDRGGAPLHFLLAHAAFSLDPSPDALRWLSVVCAVATVPVCYDLGRRLGGRVAGVTAAVVASTSSMLAVYGTIGRMYALFALVSAVAVDLFVRALERRTASAALIAALAAWLLPATHPYGLVIVAVEAAVALAVWRGRPLRPALPIFAIALALTPFVLADLRLSERFGVAASEESSLAPPDFAAKQLGDALAAFAGGAGALALVFFGLALCGLFVVARAKPAFGAFALVGLASIPVLMMIGRAEEELVHQLTPRHLMFGLPFWASLVGVGVARVVRDLPQPARVLGPAAAALALALAPAGMPDPRTETDATQRALAGPSAWVRTEVEKGSVLFFSSPVFLAGLPETREARAVPRSGRPPRMVERADFPVASVLVALPLAGSRVDAAALRERLGSRGEVGLFRDWLIVKVEGPFHDERGVLLAGMSAIGAAHGSSAARSFPFRREVRAGLLTLCDALRELADGCRVAVLPVQVPR